MYKIEGKQIAITDSLNSDSTIENYIKPFRDHVTKDLDSVLAYATEAYTKNDGDFNTALGNFMADAVFEQGNMVFNKRTGKNIDMVLLNHGGIRSSISKGNITTKTAYELMPFENSLVVVALKGNQIDSLANYLSRSKKPHPVSKLQLIINQDYNIISTAINGIPIDNNQTYYVATNDYLYNGGDNMNFFKPNDSLFDLNYKIRNILIDYFKKVDTINPKTDNRFIQVN